MAHTIVETENAKYVLIFSTHDIVKEKSPISFDALLIEAGPASQITKSSELEYKELVPQAFEQKAEFWVADPLPSEKSWRRFDRGKKFLAGTGILGILNLAFLTKKPITRRKALKTIGISAGLLTPYSGIRVATELQQHPNRITRERSWKAATIPQDIIFGKGILPIRNAIAAEKCETFLAQHLQKKLGRKPVIAVGWGTGHYGFKEFLEKPEKRRRVLSDNKLSEFVDRNFPISFRIERDEKGKWHIADKKTSPSKHLAPKSRRKSSRMSRRDLISGRFRRTRKG